MTEGKRNFPEHLTFSQRYGYELLPEPMRLEELSDELRSDLSRTAGSLLLEKVGINDCFIGDTGLLVQRVLSRTLKCPMRNITSDCDKAILVIDEIILTKEFNAVLDFLEILMEEFDDPNGLSEEFKKAFDKHGAAYWLDMSQRPYWFVPRASKEQGEAVQRDLNTIKDGGMEGAATHLRKAKRHINGGQYADSIADSIHAVESVARVIAPKQPQNLSAALEELNRAGLLKHPALTKGFKALYGYTSNEQGPC